MKNLLLKLITSLFFFTLFVFGLPKINLASASSLILNPPFGNVEAGKDLSIDVVLKGEEEIIDGVDVVASYDVNFLQVKEIKEGKFFGLYPLKKDDNGKIKITALAPKDGVKIFGDIVVATLKFEVLDTGSTDINLEFSENSTKESNAPIHTTAVDSLKSVKNGSYDVVATAENLKKARAKKSSFPFLFVFFIIILILIGVGIWYYLKKRKPKGEDVFIPEEFPLDRPPKV